MSVRNQSINLIGDGLSETWAETLVAGNVSGGTDAIMTSGDTFRGEDSAADTSPGLELTIRGGDHTSGGASVANDGGAVTISGGDTNGTGDVAGGDVTVCGGNATASNSATQGGGNLLLCAGDGFNDESGSPGGTVTIRAGDGEPSGAGDIVMISPQSSGRRTFRTGGFVGTELVDFTDGAQQILGTDSTVTLSNMATIGTNGTQVKVRVWIMGVDDAVDTEVRSTLIEQSFYTAGGTTTALTAHLSDSQINSAGAGNFATEVTFLLDVASNTIRLRATNADVANAYTFNYSFHAAIQVSGLSA